MQKPCPKCKSVIVFEKADAVKRGAIQCQNCKSVFKIGSKKKGSAAKTPSPKKPPVQPATAIAPLSDLPQPADQGVFDDLPSSPPLGTPLARPKPTARKPVATAQASQKNNATGTKILGMPLWVFITGSVMALFSLFAILGLGAYALMGGFSNSEIQTTAQRGKSVPVNANNKSADIVKMPKRASFGKPKDLDDSSGKEENAPRSGLYQFTSTDAKTQPLNITLTEFDPSAIQSSPGPDWRPRKVRQNYQISEAKDHEKRAAERLSIRQKTRDAVKDDPERWDLPIDAEPSASKYTISDEFQPLKNQRGMSNGQTYGPFLLCECGPHPRDRSGKNIVAVQDVRTGETTGHFPSGSPEGILIKRASLNPAGTMATTRIYAGNGSQKVIELWVWEIGPVGAPKEEPLTKIAIGGEIHWTGFFNDQHLGLVFTKANKTELVLWDPKTEKKVKSIKIDQSNFPERAFPSLTRAAFSATGKYFAVCSAAGLNVIDVENGKSVAMIELPEFCGGPGFQGMIEFTRDGKFLLLSIQGAIRVWSAEKGNLIGSWEPSGRDRFSPGNAFHLPESDTMVIGNQVFQISNGKVIGSLSGTLLKWPDTNGPGIMDGFSKKFNKTVSQRVKSFSENADQVAPIARTRERLSVDADRSSIAIIKPSKPDQWNAIPASPNLLDRSKHFEPWKGMGHHPKHLQWNAEKVFHFDPEKSGQYIFQHYTFANAKRQVFESLSVPQIGRIRDIGFSQPYFDVIFSASEDESVAYTNIELKSAEVSLRKGNELIGCRPYEEDTVIDWIGFKDNETLVTVGDQKLTVWKVPSFKGIYESDGGYEGTVAWGHDKTWLAVSAGNHVDLIDTTTGEILNQVWIHPTYRIFDLAVDPLGKRLIAFAVDPEAATAKNLNKLVAGAIVSCDLETGKCHSITGDFPLNEIAFCSDDHWVLTSRLNGMYYVIDFKWNTVVKSPELKHGGSPVYINGGDFVWAPAQKKGIQKRNREQPMFIGDASKLFLKPEQYAANRVVKTLTEIPIMLSLDLTTQKQSKILAPKLAENLAANGFTIGPNGWNLEVVAKQTTYTKRGLEVPQIRSNWTLFDETGNVVVKKDMHQTYSEELYGPKENWPPEEFVLLKLLSRTINSDLSWLPTVVTYVDGKPHGTIVRLVKKMPSRQPSSLGPGSFPSPEGNNPTNRRLPPQRLQRNR